MAENPRIFITLDTCAGVYRAFDYVNTNAAGMNQQKLVLEILVIYYTACLITVAFFWYILSFSKCAKSNSTLFLKQF